MKKGLLLAFAITLSGLSVFAQDEEENVEKKGFKKENLFTGGSISLGFSNNSFLVGGAPMFGYSVARWLDAGIVVNYNYTSYRDIYELDDKLKESVYGGGAFVKLYPVRFLFAQAQFEHNFIRQKYSPHTSSYSSYTYKTDVSSLLLGAGYTTSRDPDSGRPFFYLSVLFDVLKDVRSPYVDSRERLMPVLRAGVQVPLFRGGGREERW